MSSRKNPPKKTTPSKAPARGTKAVTRKPARKGKTKPRTWTRWILPALGLIAVVYAVIRVLGYYHGEQQRAYYGPIAKHPATASARILESTGKKSRRVHYTFLYKGIVYDNWQSDYNEAFRVRSCYTLRLDSTNPMRAYLLEGTEGPCADNAGLIP